MMFKFTSMVHFVRATTTFNIPYLFDYMPIDFCTKLNWKLVKSLQDRGNIFAKKKFSNATRASFECLYSAISRAIINNTNYR